MFTSIKKITLLGFCFGFFVLFFIFIAVNSHLIKTSFTDFEQEALLDDIERTRNTLNEELVNLQSTAVDWAVWDDSVAFMKGRTESYIQSNLNDKTLNTLRLSFIIYVDTASKVFFTKYRTDDGSYTSDIPPAISDVLFNKASILTKTTEDHQVSGFYAFHDDLTAITSCAIVDSEGTGPKSGILIMGRPLGQEALDAIAKKIRIKFTFGNQPASGPSKIHIAKLSSIKDHEGKSVSLYDVSANEIAGAVLLDDITQQKTLRLTVYNDKDIIQRGYTVLAKSSLVLMVGGFTLLILMILFVDRSIIRRILHLRQQLGAITEQYATNNKAEAVSVHGQDELHLLSDQINFFISESYRYKNNLEELVTEKVINLNNEISKYQNSLSELKQVNTTIIEENKTKSDYFTRATHEIRTPLNAIKGMADFLSSTELNPEQLDCTKTILEASHHLAKIVDDILDLSRIDAQKLIFEQIEFNLYKLVASTIKMLKPLADQKHISFSLHFKGDKEAIILSDPARLRQIIFNLCYNAIKFTADGAVTVTLYLVENLESNACSIDIKVQDTGIGMSQQTLENIFSPFAQGDDSIHREFGGTGLGLVICKKLVELLGGQIQVHSQQNIGSAFTVHFEAQRGSVDSLSDTGIFIPDKSLGIFRILVVDDNIINLKVATRLFSLLHQQPTCVSNTEKAIELLENETFDIIFTDIEMPDINGYEFTKIIRNAELLNINKDIPIIAMTAYSLSFQKEQCLELGMNDIIVKPIDLQKLQEVLLKFSTTGDATAQGTTGTQLHGNGISCPTGLKVLNVDDALARLGSDRILYLDVCVDLLDKCNAEKFLQLFIQRDNAPETIRSFAHSLKGSAAAAGAERVAHLANYLQNNATLEKPQLQSVYQIIHAELLRMEAELDALFSDEAYFTQNQ